MNRIDFNYSMIADASFCFRRILTMGKVESITQPTAKATIIR